VLTCSGQHPQEWIPSEPSLQPQKRRAFGERTGESSSSSSLLSARAVPGADVGGAQTTAIRTVRAGPLFFECWVEEGASKLAATARREQASRDADADTQ
jgi:hypothetical protein